MNNWSRRIFHLQKHNNATNTPYFFSPYRTRLLWQNGSRICLLSTSAARVQCAGFRRDTWSCLRSNEFRPSQQNYSNCIKTRHYNVQKCFLFRFLALYCTRTVFFFILRGITRRRMCTVLQLCWLMLSISFQ